MRIQTTCGLAVALLTVLALVSAVREDAEIRANRAKLSRGDQRLVEAQDTAQLWRTPASARWGR